MIEARALTRRFGAATALDSVSLSVGAGEYCVLLGPSGCGKTTLLNILGGFLDPTSGTLTIGGVSMTGVPAARRPTTTVFQDYALFPHMTVAENVAFGLRMRGWPRARRAARAAEMLALVGLPDAGGKRPADLSGGQKQRVALARALAVEPQVCLLDEPLGALDLGLRRAMQAELRSIQRRVGATFVHVTHDQDEAMAIADRLVVMNRGRIEDQGPPERVYRRPATRFSAGFLGETNAIPARAVAGRLSTPLGDLGPSGAPEGARLVALIRPEHLRADPAGPIRGAVREAVFQGQARRVVLDAGGVLLIARLPVTMPLGDTVALTLDPADIHTLPEDA
jgi:spermidine/putrescine transport system ATP-binding protein